MTQTKVTVTGVCPICKERISVFANPFNMAGSKEFPLLVSDHPSMGNIQCEGTYLPPCAVTAY